MSEPSAGQRTRIWLVTAAVVVILICGNAIWMQEKNQHRKETYSTASEIINSKPRQPISDSPEFFAQKFGVSASIVSVNPIPHDCDYETAPLGKKGCHYVRWATGEVISPAGQEVVVWVWTDGEGGIKSLHPLTCETDEMCQALLADGHTLFVKKNAPLRAVEVDWKKVSQ